MIEAVLLAMTGGVAIVSSAAVVSARRSQMRLCEEAAREAGLDDVTVRAPLGWPLRVEARRGPFEVSLSTVYDWHSQRMATRVEIRGVTRRLALRSVSSVAFAARRDAVPTGDRAFDAAILVAGDVAVASALLDAGTRTCVRDLCAEKAFVRREDVALQRGARLDPGRLYGERVVGDQSEWIGAFVRDLLALAWRLEEPDDLAVRLGANARDDPQPGVRLANLRALLEGYEDHEMTRTALRAGLEDADEDMRLASALALGPQGRATLLAIASSETALDGAASRAVAELRSALPIETAWAVLGRALRARRLRTAEACLDSLSRRGPEQARAIARVMEVERGPLAVAAARALGRVGGAPEVLLLREAVARVPGDGELRNAAQDAIAAIRGRLSGAEEGQVTLAEGDAGQVSFAADEAGRVSWPAPPRTPTR